MSGSFEPSHKILSQLLALNLGAPEEATKYPNLHVKILNALGECERLMSLNESALARLNSALQLSRLHKIPCTETSIVIGSVLMDQKAYSKARDTLEEALKKLAPELNDCPSEDTFRTVAGLQFNIGQCSQFMGQVGHAIQNYSSGLATLARSTIPKTDEQYLLLKKAHQAIALDTRSISSSSSQATKVFIKHAPHSASSKILKKHVGLIYESGEKLQRPSLKSYHAGHSAHKGDSSSKARTNHNSPQTYVLKTHKRIASSKTNFARNQIQTAGLMSPRAHSWKEDSQVISVKTNSNAKPFANQKQLAEELKKVNEDITKIVSPNQTSNLETLAQTTEKQFAQAKKKFFRMPTDQASRNSQLPSDARQSEESHSLSRTPSANSPKPPADTALLREEEERQRKAALQKEEEERKREEAERQRKAALALKKAENAKRLQRAWRTFRASDAWKIRKMKQKVSSAVWICNKYRHIPSESGQKRIPCKIMYYKSKIALILEISLVRPPTRKFTLETKKNSPVLDKPELLKFNKEGKPVITGQAARMSISGRNALQSPSGGHRTPANEENLSTSQLTVAEEKALREDQRPRPSQQPSKQAAVDSLLVNEIYEKLRRDLQEERERFQEEHRAREKQEEERRAEREKEIQSLKRERERQELEKQQLLLKIKQVEAEHQLKLQQEVARLKRQEEERLRSQQLEREEQLRREQEAAQLKLEQEKKALEEEEAKKLLEEKRSPEAPRLSASGHKPQPETAPIQAAEELLFQRKQSRSASLSSNLSASRASRSAAVHMPADLDAQPVKAEGPLPQSKAEVNLQSFGEFESMNEEPKSTHRNLSPTPERKAPSPNMSVEPKPTSRSDAGVKHIISNQLFIDMDIVNSKTADPMNLFSFGIESNKLESNQALLSATLGQSKSAQERVGAGATGPVEPSPPRVEPLLNPAQTIESHSCEDPESAMHNSRSTSPKNLPQFQVFQPQKPLEKEEHPHQLDSVSVVNAESEVVADEEQKLQAANRFITDFIVYRRRKKVNRTKLFEEVRLVGDVRYLLRASCPKVGTILITSTALKRRGTNDKLELTGNEAERYLNNTHQLKQKIQIKNGKISLESKEEERIELLRHIGSNDNVMTPFLGLAADSNKKSSRSIGGVKSNRFISPKNDPQTKKISLNVNESKKPVERYSTIKDNAEILQLAFDTRLSKISELSRQILAIENELTFINPFATFDFLTAGSGLFKVKLKDFESRKHNYIAVEVFDDQGKYRCAKAIPREAFNNCFSEYMTRKESKQTLVNRLIRVMKIHTGVQAGDQRAAGPATTIEFSLEKLTDEKFLTLRHFDNDDLY